MYSHIFLEDIFSDTFHKVGEGLQIVGVMSMVFYGSRFFCTGPNTQQKQQFLIFYLKSFSYKQKTKQCVLHYVDSLLHRPVEHPVTWGDRFRAQSGVEHTVA